MYPANGQGRDTGIAKLAVGVIDVINTLGRVVGSGKGDIAVIDYPAHLERDHVPSGVSSSPSMEREETIWNGTRPLV